MLSTPSKKTRPKTSPTALGGSARTSRARAAPLCPGSPRAQGAEEADGIDVLIRVVRDQIAKGADWIKFYADFLAANGRGVRPSFTLDEMKRIVAVANNAGISVVAHATSKEGMRLASRRCMGTCKGLIP
jgi:imidazolonepropionase-like amidohydrolase